MHNVLKGIRSLSPELADQLLRHLGLTLKDLKAPEERGNLFVLTPVMRGGTGAACFPFTRERHEGVYPFPTSLVAALKDPVALILHDDRCMTPRFQGNDLVLLDQSEACRSAPDADSAYVVETSEGTAVRFIRHGGRSLYVVTEQTKEFPDKWEYISLVNKNILEIIRGRIAWIGRDQPPIEYMGRGGGTKRA